MWTEMVMIRFKVLSQSFHKGAVTSKLQINILCQKCKT